MISKNEGRRERFNKDETTNCARITQKRVQKRIIKQGKSEK